MDIELTGKGIDITPAIRSFTENKLQKLTRLIDSVMDVHITLSVQKYMQIADVTVKTRNGRFSSSGQTKDMYASINEAIESLLKQVRRQTKRIKSHKGRNRGLGRNAWKTKEVPREVKKKKQLIRHESLPVKPMSLEEARLQLMGGDNDFLLYRDTTSSSLKVIYRRKDGNLGLIDPQL